MALSDADTAVTLPGPVQTRVPAQMCDARPAGALRTPPSDL